MYERFGKLEVSIENRDKNQEWLEGSEWTIEVGWGESRVVIGGQSKSYNRCFILYFNNVQWNVWNWMHVCDILSIFVFSRNFPETAWRALKVARRLKLFLWCLWVPEMGPPGGTTRPAKRRLETYQFFGFLLELPGGNDQPSTRTFPLIFGIFEVLGWFCSGEKLAKSLKSILDNIMLVKITKLMGESDGTVVDILGLIM